MRIRTLHLVLVILLAAVSSQAYAYISENPRQGLAPVSAAFHPESTSREPRLLLGFELRFLHFRFGIGVVTKDPIGFFGGMNLWRYTNNPLRYTDPWGLQDFIGIQNPSNPLRFFLIQTDPFWIAEKEFTESEIDDIHACQAVFVKFPGGKSPSETLQFIYSEGGKLLLLHQVSTAWDDWFYNSFGTIPKSPYRTTPISETDVNHIFRDKHSLADTPESRQLLIDTASDFGNYLGPDSRGNAWFAKNLPNGQQVWTVVRDGMIRQGGINETPRTYNPQTGLSFR